MLELLKIYVIDEKLLKCVLGGIGEDGRDDEENIYKGNVFDKILETFHQDQVAG